MSIPPKLLRLLRTDSSLPSRAVARRALASLVLATGLAAATAVPAAHASTAESAVNSGNAPLIGGFSARALGENGEVTPKTYFEIKLKPGESFDGKILVTNASEDFTRLKVDSVDGLTGQTSGTVYANRTDPRTETSLWIKPKKKALRMDPDSSRTLSFRLKVPDDATPGDHVGAVAFQRILNPKKKGEFSVRQVLRVAVAIQIKVVGPANAQLGIGAISLSALGGTQIPSVNVELKNTGQLLCRPTLTVALKSGGESLGTVSRQLDTILAGDTIKYPLPWPKPLEPGTYEVAAGTTGCGEPANATATVKLDGALRGSTSNPGPDPATFKQDGGIPWWALLVAVLGALGIGFFFARRTSRKKDDPQAPQPAAVAPSDASATAAPAGAPAPAPAASAAPATAEHAAPVAVPAPAAGAPASESAMPAKAVVIEPEPAPAESRDSAA